MNVLPFSAVTAQYPKMAAQMRGMQGVYLDAYMVLIIKIHDVSMLSSWLGPASVQRKQPAPATARDHTAPTARDWHVRVHHQSAARQNPTIHRLPRWAEYPRVRQSG